MSSSPKYVNSQRSTRLGRSTLLILSCLVVLGISGFVFGLTSYYILYSYRGFRCLNSGNPLSIGVPLDKMAIHGSATSGINDNGGKRRHKVLGFVGIQTGFGSSGRRRSLRKTWMPSDRASLQRLKESTGLAMRFVIGRTKDEALMSELEKEIALYDDFLLLDIEEHYNNLPHKTMAYFRAAFALFDAKFYVKIDDDIYLRPDRLSMLLAKERSHPYTYIGCMKKGPFYKDPKHKWHEPLSYMLGKEYFLHAYGAIYALSADVVATLVSVRNDSIRMFRNEDVTIGAWMLAMAVNHEDNRALCEEECTSSSIAVWTKHICSGVCHAETNLLELHQNETCSKGPTLNA